MSRITYNTKQKQIIYDFLLNNQQVLLTCDEISDALKESGTPVGKATLYRFLDALVSSSQARKVIDENKKCAAYQLLDKEMKCDCHMHLKCTDCGSLVHLGCDFMHSVGEHILNHHQFKIDNSKTLIYGVCSKCSEKAGK
ncbi:MAG: transcriptional repressor [Clostridia bacterium]|nr:transcriptional repressor [Clostridia bacterium]